MTKNNALEMFNTDNSSILKKNIPNPKGRPYKNKEPLNSKITINFTEKEKNKILHNADKNGQTISTYIKRSLEKLKVI